MSPPLGEEPPSKSLQSFQPLSSGLLWGWPPPHLGFLCAPPPSGGGGAQPGASLAPAHVGPALPESPPGMAWRGVCDGRGPVTQLEELVAPKRKPCPPFAGYSSSPTSACCPLACPHQHQGVAKAERWGSAGRVALPQSQCWPHPVLASLAPPQDNSSQRSLTR